MNGPPSLRQPCSVMIYTLPSEAKGVGSEASAICLGPIVYTRARSVLVDSCRTVLLTSLGLSLALVEHTVNHDQLLKTIEVVLLQVFVRCLGLLDVLRVKLTLGLPEQGLDALVQVHTLVLRLRVELPRGQLKEASVKRCLALTACIVQLVATLGVEHEASLLDHL